MRRVFLIGLLVLWSHVSLASDTSTCREVAVGLYLVDITRIDENANTFTADLDVFVSWQDSTLAFDPEIEGSEIRVFSGKEASKLRGDIWTAQIFPTNPVGKMNLGGEKILVHSNGLIEFTLRINSTMRALLDYRDFPFDTQVLPMELESFSWNRDEVCIVPDMAHIGFDQFNALAEWEVVSFDVDQYEKIRVRDVVPFSNLVFKVSVKRDSGFYIWKIFFTVIIIVSLTWVVFWMSGEGLGRRAGVSSGGMLTVIAYQFVATSSLPRVSYLTVADKIMILSVLVIAATMVESLMVDGMTHSNLPRKTKIDKICRVVFPVFYFSALLILAMGNGLLG